MSLLIFMTEPQRNGRKPMHNWKWWRAVGARGNREFLKQIICKVLARNFWILNLTVWKFGTLFWCKIWPFENLELYFVAEFIRLKIWGIILTLKITARFYPKGLNSTKELKFQVSYIASLRMTRRLSSFRNAPLSSWTKRSAVKDLAVLIAKKSASFYPKGLIQLRN